MVIISFYLSEKVSIAGLLESNLLLDVCIKNGQCLNVVLCVWVGIIVRITIIQAKIFAAAALTFQNIMFIFTLLLLLKILYICC